MTPRSARPNGFEIEGRRMKVEKLVAAIDREFEGKPPEFGMVDAIERTWKPEDWKRVAEANHIRKPSVTTILAVIAEYRRRERATRAA